MSETVTKEPSKAGEEPQLLSPLTEEELARATGLGDIPPEEEPVKTDVTAEPSADVTATEPTVEETPEPEPEPDKEPKAVKGKEWDKTRQAKDQEIANLRKELAAAKEKLTKPEKVAATGDLPALDEYSTVADVAKHLTAVNAKLAQVEQERAEERKNSQETENLAAYNQILDTACKMEGVGEDRRNDLATEMRRIYTERGYSEDHYPNRYETEDLAFRIALEMTLEGKKTPPPVKPKPAEKVFTGKGAKPAGDSIAIPEGPPEVVARHMAAAAKKGSYPPGWIR